MSFIFLLVSWLVQSWGFDRSQQNRTWRSPCTSLLLKSFCTFLLKLADVKKSKVGVIGYFNLCLFKLEHPSQSRLKQSYQDWDTKDPKDFFKDKKIGKKIFPWFPSSCFAMICRCDPFGLQSTSIVLAVVLADDYFSGLYLIDDAITHVNFWQVRRQFFTESDFT